MKKMIPTKALYLIGILQLLILNCFSQKLPRMYVERDIAIERKAFFLMKSHFLETDAGLNMITKDSIFFPIASFRAMVQYFGNVGINITFARFPNTSPFMPPSGWSKQLTILFSPVVGATPTFYVLNDHGSFSGNNNLLPDSVAKAWIADYSTNVMPVLVRTINRSAPENQYGGAPSDTRSIYYCADAIKEFIKEIDNQNTLHSDTSYTTGVKCFFSAYGKDGIRLSDGSKLYKKRLILQFAFTKNGEEVYEIDPTGRTKNEDVCDPMKDLDPLLKPFFIIPKAPPTFDNGQLCPANCP